MQIVKRKIFWTGLYSLIGIALQAQTPFITTWKTDNPGSSCDSCITIPTTGTGYDYAIDWNNDGVFDTSGVTGSITHDFGTPGTYTIQIRGDFPRINFFLGGDKDKILSVDQWGTGIAWSSMQFAFYGCTNLRVPATDAPNLTSATSLAHMFDGASVFNDSIDHWDVSNITDMSAMFSNADSFNQVINNWDVSSVTLMNLMFAGADVFNQPLNNWDVSLVTDMSGMFSINNVFNQPLDMWDVSSVTNMFSMFFAATVFNQPLGGWDISSVTNMEDIFKFTSLDTKNYDLTLTAWSSLTVQSNVTIGVDGLTFCAIDARNILKDHFSWTFVGDMPGLPSTASFIPSSGEWYEDVNNWSTMEFPSFCTDVTIPVNKSVSILSGMVGIGNTLTVELGGALDIPQGAELFIQY